MVSVMYGTAGLGETIFTGTLIFVLRRSRTGFKRQVPNYLLPET